jgi:hypothetical protein
MHMPAKSSLCKEKEEATLNGLVCRKCSSAKHVYLFDLTAKELIVECPLRSFTQVHV